VSFACSNLPALTTCVFTPAQIAAGSGNSSAALSINTSPGTPMGNYNVTITGTSGTVISTAQVSITVTAAPTFDFAMSVTPGSESVPVGQSTTFTVDVNPSTGSFPSTVTFSCANLPQLATCSFSPAQIGSGSGNSVSAVTMSTTAPTASTALNFFFLTPFSLAGAFWIDKRRLGQTRRKSRPCLRFLAFLVLLFTQLSCGGGLQGNGTVGSGNPGTPTGTYNVTVTATSATLSHSAQVSLTVTQ